MADLASSAATGAAAGSVIPGIGTIVGGIGGILASIFGSGQDNQATKQLQNDIRKLQETGVPSIDAQKLALDKYVSAGHLDPSLVTAYKQADSEYKKIKTNPAYKEAELRALDQLQDLGSSGGLTINDKANLAKANIDARAEDRGRRDAIVTNAEARGVGGAGTTLAAQLSGIQQTGDREATNALSTMGDARARALKAITDAGELGGQLENQDFGEQSQKASAQDQIKRFNTVNAQSVADRNNDSINAAKLRNINTDQDISNKNVTTSNEQQKYNSGLIQNQFENELQKQQAVLAAENGQQAQQNLNNKTGATMAGNIGAGIAGLGAAVDAFGNKKPAAPTAGDTTSTAGDATPITNDSRYNDDDENAWWKTTA